MKPWGTDDLLDTMVSLSRFGKWGWEFCKYAAEENSGTEGRTRDAKSEGPRSYW